MKSLWKIITQKSLVTHKSQQQQKAWHTFGLPDSHSHSLALGLTLALAVTHYELSCWGLIVFTKQCNVLSVRGRSSLNFETHFDLNSLISWQSCNSVWVWVCVWVFECIFSAEVFFSVFTVPCVVWVIYVTASRLCGNTEQRLARYNISQCHRESKVGAQLGPVKVGQRSIVLRVSSRSTSIIFDLKWK